MKNTEWGAVAYLSHSKYGINKEVNINNNSSYKTGYSALKSTNQQTYPGETGDGNSYNSLYSTEIGYLASTTGNITGVYDMAGGSWEYMASHIDGNVGQSGFSTIILDNYDTKYFDIYNSSSTITGYQYRILGDATGEMGPFNTFLYENNVTRYHSGWYGDYSCFVGSSYPWFHRGGQNKYSVLAGTFYFDYYSGGTHNGVGYRIVLAP